MAFIKQVKKATGTRWYVHYREHGRQRAKVVTDQSEAEAFFPEKDWVAADPSSVPFERFYREVPGRS